MPRYRFDDFIVSPRRRLLLRAGREQPLIPRYFDLLVFLIERRGDAVHRREIFDRVWTDVVVSDSALSQAVRTIRRALVDDPREPRFIRTVSRHGYRFVWTDVIEEDDDGPEVVPVAAAEPSPEPDPFEPLLARIVEDAGDGDEEDRREAAELLHAQGTAETLRRLGTRPGHVRARALLRDTRWDAPHAGAVPILGQPAPIATAGALIRLRARRAARIAAARWMAASIGGGVAGACAGAVGGVALALAPDSAAPISVAVVLAVVGAGCGAAGGAGVGAGLSVAETVARSRRTLALLVGGAVGGGLVGLAVQWLGRWSLAALVGVHVAIGGGIEGVLIGGATGLGYAIATSLAEGGIAAPRGRRRLRAVALTAAAGGLAGLALTFAGRPLAGGTVHVIAQSSLGSQVILTPLGRLMGEAEFGPFTQALLGTGEGAVFGLGLAFGLTRRP